MSDFSGSENFFQKIFFDFNLIFFEKWLFRSGTIYGPDVSVPTTEDTANNPICSYGIVKLAIEKYATLYRQQGKLESIILRISNPFGPYQSTMSQGFIGASIQRLHENKPIEIWGDGRVIRDFVYIDDVADAIVLSVELDNDKAPHIYNIGSGIGRSLNKVVDSIANIHGPITVNNLHGRQVDVSVSVLDIRLAESFLGWKPHTDWMDALRKTYLWHKKSN